MKIDQLITQEIILPPTFGVPEKSESIRNELLQTSAQFQLATTQAQANSLAEAARDIRTFIKEVRDLGLTLRRPLKAAQERIKLIEDDFCLPLEVEQGRLERIAGDYHAAERRRVAEEERLRRAEIDRLEAIRREEERKANEVAERIAEENRLAEEAARATEAKITNQKQLAAAIKAEAARKAEADKRQAEADAAAEAARKASEASQAKIREALPAVHKPGGMTTKRVMRYEVTDIHAVYKAKPELVKLEIKPSAVIAVCFPEHPVEGLRLWWADDTSTRAWGR
jgi:hypothetical protein